MREAAIPAAQAGGQLRATEDNILGPYHRANAPFRGKITPPLEPGTVLVISGRVLGPRHAPAAAEHAARHLASQRRRAATTTTTRNVRPPPIVFLNRARLMTDENGYYEYETIHPGAYRIGPNAWRPPHIHYWVRQADYRELVTQLYFRGDPHQRDDQFIRHSLIIDLREVRTPARHLQDRHLRHRAGGAELRGCKDEG